MAAKTGRALTRRLLGELERLEIAARHAHGTLAASRTETAKVIGGRTVKARWLTRVPVDVEAVRKQYDALAAKASLQEPSHSQLALLCKLALSRLPPVMKYQDAFPPRMTRPEKVRDTMGLAPAGDYRVGPLIRALWDEAHELPAIKGVPMPSMPHPTGSLRPHDARSPIKSLMTWAKSAKPKPKKTGEKRGGRQKYDPVKDAKLERDWQAAARNRAYKPDWCRERGITFRELDLALLRQRERRLKKPRAQ